MILYNVTVNVEDSIEKDWMVWVKEVHIPEVLQTGCFIEHKLLRLLNDDPDATGVTYAIQYFAVGLDKLEKYLNDYAPDLHEKEFARYQNRLVSFRTFLEEV